MAAHSSGAVGGSVAWASSPGAAGGLWACRAVPPLPVNGVLPASGSGAHGVAAPRRRLPRPRTAPPRGARPRQQGSVQGVRLPVAASLAPAAADSGEMCVAQAPAGSAISSELRSPVGPPQLSRRTSVPWSGCGSGPTSPRGVLRSLRARRAAAAAGGMESIIENTPYDTAQNRTAFTSYQPLSVGGAPPLIEPTRIGSPRAGGSIGSPRSPCWSPSGSAARSPRRQRRGPGQDTGAVVPPAAEQRLQPAAADSTAAGGVLFSGRSTQVVTGRTGLVPSASRQSMDSWESAERDRSPAPRKVRRLHKLTFIEWQDRRVKRHTNEAADEIALRWSQQQARWDAWRSEARAQELRRQQAAAARRDKLRQKRQDRMRGKALRRQERDQVELAERAARRGLVNVQNRWMRDFEYLRWRDGVDIFYGKQLRATQLREVELRDDIAITEVQQREHTIRTRFLDRVAFVRLAQLGARERDTRALLQRWVDEVRRFRAEQESQTTRLHQQEQQMREKCLSDEVWHCMEIERFHDDWKKVQEDIRREREKVYRAWLREIGEEHQLQRSDLCQEESGIRANLRVTEASDRLDLSEMGAQMRRDAKQREAERIDAETAVLRAQQAAERLPIQQDEAAGREALEQREGRIFERLEALFAVGRDEILKPCILVLPEPEISHIAGSNPLIALTAAKAVLKQRYNPYSGSAVVAASLDAGITEGWTRGDSLGLFRCPTNEEGLRRGFGLFRFHGRFRQLVRLARCTARRDTDGQWPQPPSSSPLGHRDWEGLTEGMLPVDSEDLDQAAGAEDGTKPPVQYTGANRWLRFQMCLSKERSLWEDITWILRRISFSIRREADWYPRQDLGPVRELALRLTVTFTPNPSDRAAGVRLATFSSHRVINIEPAPPLLWLPRDRRYQGYEIGLRGKDGQRLPARVMQAVQELHPERDAGGALITARLISPEAPDANERMTLKCEGVDIRSGPKGRVTILMHGTEVADVKEGNAGQSNDCSQRTLVLRVRDGIQHWKAVEMIRSIQYVTQQQHPLRPRRQVVVTFAERESKGGSGAQTTVDSFMNILMPLDVAPTFMVLTESSHHCIVWRSSGGDTQEHLRKWLEPAVAPVSPDAVVENQNCVGIPECGPPFSGGELSMRIEQGCQSGDTLLVRSSTQKQVSTGKTLRVEVDEKQRSVHIMDREFARWTSELGGMQSSGTYEGSTSSAWIKLEILPKEYTELELRSLLRCICFTNRTQSSHPGIRHLSARLAVKDALISSSPPATVNFGIRCCLPIMVLPQRYQVQKYVENDGAKRLGMFDLPEPVFKDDEAVAVFDGGSVTVELLEGAEGDDMLGLGETQSKEYDLTALRNELAYRVTAHGSQRQLSIFIPHCKGERSFTMKLGNRAERRKAVDILHKKPHANGVRKRELQAILRNLYYSIETDAPKKLQKVLRVTAEDAFGARSQCVLEMNIQCINDQTEVHLRSEVLRYRQRSRQDHRGFQLAPGVTLSDPDTPEIRGGFVSFELSVGGDRYDRLGLLSPEQQLAALPNNTPEECRVAVTLGPPGPGDHGQPRVLLGGLQVGSFEFRGGKRGTTAGQTLRINIGLNEPWPGWSCLPCHHEPQMGRQDSRDPFTREISMSGRGDRTPPDSRRGSKVSFPQAKGGMIGGGVPAGGPVGMWPSVLAAGMQGAGSPTGERRQSRGITALRAIHAAQRVQRGVASIAASLVGKAGKLKGPASPKAYDTSQPTSPVPQPGGGDTPNSETGKGFAPERPKYGLPLDVAQRLMEVVAYCNCAPASAVKPGLRTYTIKVNAGDDVADTKVKVGVEVLLPLLRALADPTVRYVEGSDWQPVAPRLVSGLPSRAQLRRGWIRVEVLSGWEEGEDELGVHDTLREITVAWECTPRGEPPKPAGRTRRRSTASSTVLSPKSPSRVPSAAVMSPHSPTASIAFPQAGVASTTPFAADGVWGALLVDPRLDKKLGNDAPANPYYGCPYLGRARRVGPALELHFDQSSWAVSKHIPAILRSLCYRNTSSTPACQTRQVRVEMLWADAAAVPDPTEPPDLDAPGYDHCAVDLEVNVEDVDNPTEIVLATEEVPLLAGASGIAPKPLFVFPGVQVSDPDTPFFDPPGELQFEVVGGGKIDALDISPHPPEGVIDGIQIHGSDLCLHDTKVATFVRTPGQPSRLALGLDHCPVEALAPILQRLVYRHLGQPKKILKKHVQVTIVAASDGGKPAPPSRAKVCVTMHQPILDYPGAAMRCSQVGTRPLPLLPNVTKTPGALTGAEILFELVSAPTIPAAPPHLIGREDDQVARRFWFPWEGLGSDCTLRPPDPRDAIIFLADELPNDLQRRDGAEPSTIELLGRDGRVCTISSRVRCAGAAGAAWAVRHELHIAFAVKPQGHLARFAATVVHAVCYAQVQARPASELEAAVAEPVQAIKIDSGQKTLDRRNKSVGPNAAPGLVSPKQAAIAPPPKQLKGKEGETVPAPEGTPEVLVRITSTVPGSDGKTGGDPLHTVDYCRVRPRPLPALAPQ
eukprot:TRINITY_DN9763_c2_g1_i1.p1 TRINITY_DN9763_c2_g1~~TRINITY_DN9763_c2_g1_i1.p1  ORF type:complete len:2512 (+),score=500.06 TRINITY_DN9763_c2_g1_i1:77-7612(+)